MTTPTRTPSESGAAGEPTFLASRRGVWVGPALIVVAILILYLPSLRAPFIFDDIGSIIENPTIRSLWDWRAVLAARPQETVAGRPVVNATLALNFAIHEFDVRGYRIFNIVVFILSSLALWGIVRHTAAAVLARRWPPPTASDVADDSRGTLVRASWLASAVVLLWAVHPIQSETVVYIVQRTELLKAMFYFVTLYASMKWLISPRGGWLALAIISCALGMGCKESMVSAPLMVLVYDRLFVEKNWAAALKKHRALYLGLALTWSILLALSVTAPRSMSVGFHLGISSIDYLATQAHVLVHYLRLCFWPTPLTVAYDWPIEHDFSRAIPAGLGIVALFAFSIWLLIKRHWLAAPWAMFFMVLGPTSSFIPIATEVAVERRMHMPLLAVILSLLSVVYWVFERRVSRAFVTAAILVLLMAIPLAWATANRLTDYRDSKTIWLAAIKARSGFPTPTANQYLAQYYANRGMDELALPYILENTRLLQGNPAIHDGAGRLLLRMGRPVEAIPHLRTVVEKQRGIRGAFMPQINLARALRAAGQQEESLAIIRSLLSDPDVPQQLVAAELEFDSVIEQLRARLSTNPRDADAHTAWGLALAKRGDIREAILHFKSALEIDPSRTDARDYLARANLMIVQSE